MSDDAAGMARFVALLADRTRMAMCLALLDGRAWTSGELSRLAGVSASTASEHASRLVTSGLLAEHRQGRFRYLRLAGPDVAAFLEDLAALSGASQLPPSSLRAARVSADLAAARTCYDHLAGRLGVAVFDAMLSRGLVTMDKGPAVTARGVGWFAELDLSLRSASRRPVVRTCLDWTERRPHLAGVAESVLRSAAVERGWVVPRPDQRAVTVTRFGSDAFRSLLGIEFKRPRR